MWTDHFEWEGASLRGKTPVGRTTINVLALNDPDSLAVRKALQNEGIFHG